MAQLTATGYCDCWKALGRAIVIRAILDYQKATRELRRAKKSNQRQKIESCQATITECGEFLQSKYCRVISGVDGRKVLPIIMKIKLPEDYHEREKLIFDTPRSVDYKSIITDVMKGA